MKKGTNLLNAFKAFEIKNTQNVLGGKKTCTCTDGATCDIYDDKTKTTETDVSDKGIELGDSWGAIANLGSVSATAVRG